MVCFTVKKIAKIELIPIPEDILTELNSKIRFPSERGMPAEPFQHEMGYLFLDVEVIDGIAKEAKHVYFICDQLIKATIVRHTNDIFKNQVQLSFDGAFPYGFEKSINSFVRPGSSFFALTEEELQTSNKLIIQENILNILSSNLLPDYTSKILESKRIGFYFEFSEDEKLKKSFAIGKIKQLENLFQLTNKTNTPLMHLCTIYPNELSVKLFDSSENYGISFFLKITDTENGWPEKKDEFSVTQSKDRSILKYPLDITYSNEHLSIEMKPSYDIPEPEGYFSYNLGLNEDEKLCYRVLHFIYHEIVINWHYKRMPSKFLGHPISEQYCVNYEAERISKKLKYDDSIHKEAEDWCLLLFINPYDKWFNFFDKFGDGSIYFMIKKEDLNNMDFRNVQLVVQNS